MTRAVRTKVPSLIIRSLPVARPETDTGKRILDGQRAIALGESFDKQWLFVDAPAGDGWASATYLEDAPDPAPLRLTVPNGRAEIVALFGPPCEDACERGRVILPAPLPLSWAPQQRATRFACHEKMVPVFTAVFQEIHDRGLWHLLEDFGGCFNCREQRGGGTTSTHSWGISVDLNARQNPLGAEPKMPPEITEIFERHGFQWGGRWKRKDGMHYQFATGT